MPNCNHKYVAGKKSGTECGRFVRAKKSSTCYQHKQKDGVKPELNPEVKPEEIKAEEIKPINNQR
jgi:hypothetical protein